MQSVNQGVRPSEKPTFARTVKDDQKSTISPTFKPDTEALYDPKDHG